jgi:hypothetical protein
MKTYRFIKISNNNNPSQDFFIDITTMQSVKLRMSILKSQLKYYKKTWIGLYRPTWYYIDNCDYSYYELDKADFETYDEAKQHAIKLYNDQFVKMNNTRKTINTNKYIISLD